MSSQDVNGIVALGINTWFTGADSSKIKNCVAGYSKQSGVSANLQQMMYRICNAVKSIFGQSDWQIARNTMSNRIVYVVPFAFLVPKESLDKLSNFALRGLVFTNETLPRLPAPMEALLFNPATEALLNVQQNYKTQIAVLKQGVDNTIKVGALVYAIASPILGNPAGQTALLLGIARMGQQALTKQSIS